MRKEAASGGFYTSPMAGKHPKVQILTIDQLLRREDRLSDRIATCGRYASEGTADIDRAPGDRQGIWSESL